MHIVINSFIAFIITIIGQNSIQAQTFFSVILARCSPIIKYGIISANIITVPNLQQ